MKPWPSGTVCLEMTRRYSTLMTEDLQQIHERVRFYLGHNRCYFGGMNAVRPYQFAGLDSGSFGDGHCVSHAADTHCIDGLRR